MIIGANSKTLSCRMFSQGNCCFIDTTTQAHAGIVFHCSYFSILVSLCLRMFFCFDVLFFLPWWDVLLVWNVTDNIFARCQCDADLKICLSKVDNICCHHCWFMLKHQRVLLLILPAPVFPVSLVLYMPLQNSSLTMSAIGLRSYDIILGDFSHTLLCLCYMQCLGYWDSHKSRKCLWVSIFAVPTADPVATGEVSCYSVIVRLYSPPQFAEVISWVL